MPDYPEEFMQAEKMDRIVEEMEMLILDALLSIVQKLQERMLRQQRLDSAQQPGRPYF
jgi:hypothetical protein